MNKRKLLKILTVAFVILSVLMIGAAIVLPTGKSYTYENNEIVTHSVRSEFASFCAGVILFGCLWFIGLTAGEVALRIKEGAGALKVILGGLGKLLTGFVCGFLLTIAIIMAEGLWTKDDYYPEWYMFTDGNHTIVIEEMSFLLDGRAEIYQIMENNKAVPINMFTTDDGETNCGHYKMEWTEEYVDITYRTFVTADSVKTLRVKFID
ncbi:MAG: hypothetical protein K2K57_03955 [Oscillospiraceae bacterium]|nr:hypothetical protein [Oscillospiraceae bacterium]